MVNIEYTKAIFFTLRKEVNNELKRIILMPLYVRQFYMKVFRSIFLKPAKKLNVSLTSEVFTSK